MSDSKPMTTSDRVGCLVLVVVMGGTGLLLSRSGAGFWGWVFGLTGALFVSFLLIGIVTSMFETKSTGNANSGEGSGNAAPVVVARPRGRVCPRCGREGLARVAKFCPVCGQSLRKRRQKKDD
jgi:hypothetical protein